MRSKRLRPPWITNAILGFLLTGIALLFAPVVSQAAPQPVDAVKKDRDIEALARAAQQNGRWLEACRLYEEVCRKDKPSAEAREALQECTRRYYLSRRHNDRTYHDALAKLAPADEALKIYQRVLDTLSKHYVDPSKTDVNTLFHQGVQELLYALDEEAFTNEYLTTSDKKLLEPLRLHLHELRERKIESWPEARTALIKLAAVTQELGLAVSAKRTVIPFALEFACGAINSLDEYSFFLTPFHLNALRGKYVGVGVDLAITDQRLEIARVYPNSPAAELDLKPGDRILQIDKQPVENLSPDVVAERLLGEADTVIELEVWSVEQLKSRSVRLLRRSIVMSSVEQHLLTEMELGMGSSSDDLIGYIRIYSFQETTTQEVKEAIAQLQTAGMKARSA